MGNACDETEFACRGKEARIMRDPVAPQYGDGPLERALMHRIQRSCEPVFGAVVKPARGTGVQPDLFVAVEPLRIAAEKSEVSKADPLDDHRQGFPEIGE